MDILILAQAFLYYCMVVAGLAVSITTGVNRGRFDGQCILYGSFHKIEDLRLLKGGPPSTCDYLIYVSVIGMVIYGVLMGAYYSYCLHKSRRDPNIGFQMWLMPVFLLNLVLFILSFMAALHVSFGYAIFCNNYLEGKPSGVKCSVGENRDWLRVGTNERFNPGNYVSFMNTSIIFAWLGVLFINIQIALGFQRVYHARHQEPDTR